MKMLKRIYTKGLSFILSIAVLSAGFSVISLLNAVADTPINTTSVSPTEIMNELGYGSLKEMCNNKKTIKIENPQCTSAGTTIYGPGASLEAGYYMVKFNAIDEYGVEGFDVTTTIDGAVKKLIDFSSAYGQNGVDDDIQSFTEYTLNNGATGANYGNLYVFFYLSDIVNVCEIRAFLDKACAVENERTTGNLVRQICEIPPQKDYYTKYVSDFGDNLFHMALKGADSSDPNFGNYYYCGQEIVPSENNISGVKLNFKLNGTATIRVELRNNANSGVIAASETDISGDGNFKWHNIGFNQNVSVSPGQKYYLAWWMVKENGICIVVGKTLSNTLRHPSYTSKLFEGSTENTLIPRYLALPFELVTDQTEPVGYTGYNDCAAAFPSFHVALKNAGSADSDYENYYYCGNEFIPTSNNISGAVITLCLSPGNATLYTEIRASLNGKSIASTITEISSNAETLSDYEVTFDEPVSVIPGAKYFIIWYLVDRTSGYCIQYQIPSEYAGTDCRGIKSRVSTGGTTETFDYIVDGVLPMTVIQGEYYGGAGFAINAGLGDINKNAKYDAVDALAILRHVAGKNILSGISIEQGDVNFDGAHTSADALLVLQRAVELIDKFENEGIFNKKMQNLTSGKKRLRFNQNGEFKVMQITDLHNNANGGHLHGETAQSIETLISECHPDLFVITGDIIWEGFNGFSNAERYVMAKGIIDDIDAVFAKYRIPYCVCFGNHDSQIHENLCLVSRAMQMELYSSHEYCIAIDGNVTENDGKEERVGNFVLPVAASDGSDIAFNVWVMDTGSDNSTYGYDYINDDQVSWYKNTSYDMEKNLHHKVYGAMFGHIPLYEFRTVLAGDRVDYNVTGQNHEGASGPNANISKIFDTYLERGDIKGYYCGHDHINDISWHYQGIELAFGGSIAYDGYGGYYGAATWPYLAGARMLTINESDPANYRSEFVSYADIVENTAKPITTTTPKFKDADNIIDFESDVNIELIAAAQSPVFSVENGVGYDGSNGLKITTNAGQTPTNSISCDNTYFTVDLPQTILYSTDRKYLRLWIDMPDGIDFRKCSFGLIDSNGIEYTLDNNDGNILPFYILPEGTSDWKLRHTDIIIDNADGCIGAYANGSLKDFTGWIAVDTTLFKDASGNTLANGTSIEKFQMFYDINCKQMFGKCFMLDSVALTEQFNLFK